MKALVHCAAGHRYLIPLRNVPGYAPGTDTALGWCPLFVRTARTVDDRLLGVPCGHAITSVYHLHTLLPWEHQSGVTPREEER